MPGLRVLTLQACTLYPERSCHVACAATTFRR